jgi:hypothetical protein
MVEDVVDVDSINSFVVEGPPHLVASYDTRGDVEDLF